MTVAARLAFALVAILAIAGLGGALLVARAPAEPAAALGPPRFVEEALAAGLAHAYDGEFQFLVGGGVAALDCDYYGRPDLFLAGGSEPAALFRNTGEIGGSLSVEHLP